jgi:hypothetical protein
MTKKCKGLFGKLAAPQLRKGFGNTHDYAVQAISFCLHVFKEFITYYKLY